MNTDQAKSQEINAAILSQNLDPKKLSARERRLFILYQLEKAALEPDSWELSKQFGVSRNVINSDLSWCYAKISEYVSLEDVQKFITRFIARKEILYRSALDQQVYHKDGSWTKGDLRLANDIANDLFDRLSKIGWLGKEGSQPIPQHILKAEQVNILNISSSNPDEVNKILDKSISRCREYQQVLTEEKKP